MNNSGTIWLLDFVKGEARLITAEESARMAMEFAKRCVVKDGVVYVDCKPPADSEPDK